MPSAWRLTKTRHLKTAWDGEGARRFGGRWNSIGTALVYVSASLSLALTETLVHIQSAALPAFSAIPVEFDQSLVAVLDGRDLPTDWNRYPPRVSTQKIGDLWVKGAKSAALRVPSVVVPVEFNYLLNPAHPDFKRIRIGKPEPFRLDPRLRQ